MRYRFPRAKVARISLQGEYEIALSDANQSEVIIDAPATWLVRRLWFSRMVQIKPYPKGRESDRRSTGGAVVEITEASRTGIPVVYLPVGHTVEIFSI